MTTSTLHPHSLSLLRRASPLLVATFHSPSTFPRITALPPPSIGSLSSPPLKRASVKRFRVAGTVKIVRRCAGKQHMLSKKNSESRERLSKMA
ncbi:hypothetical protein QYE76_036831 [Lolium multiflorum]|uniref:50S ribosomal protein L35 n=1 Tax=Lolium multiflorum TaxID=4521 RepID=A0AAD8VQL0_LOLMU|nr:hypothetical protein QYE76_036831 [Lolium multiflorum]